jgi:transposase
VPHGHWHTTTFVAGLRHDDITAPMVADGAMTGALFLKYVQECLCPTLYPGDLVIADNLRSHKVAGVKEAVGAVGAHIRYFPPYSPESESHRKTVCQNQSSAPQGRQHH